MKNSIEKTMIEILNRTAGMTKEELATALGSNSNTVRSLISLNRSKGVRIVDTLTPSGSGKNFFKKKYKIASNNEEYFGWCVRQLGNNIPPVLGTPKV